MLCHSSFQSLIHATHLVSISTSLSLHLHHHQHLDSGDPVLNPKTKTLQHYSAVSDPQGHPVKLSNVQTANWAHQHLIWNTRLFLVLKALKISIKNVLTEVHYNSCKTCIFLTTVSTLVQVYYRPLTPPLSCPLSDRDVSSLIRTAQCGTLSSRSSAPSVSPYGTSTTMASSSQLERDGTPSSWRRRDPWETTHSPSRKGCRTWR